MQAIADVYDQNGELVANWRVDGRTAPHGFEEYMRWNYTGYWAVAYVKLRGKTVRIANKKKDGQN